jgi:hypothetical protein
LNIFKSNLGAYNSIEIFSIAKNPRSFYVIEEEEVHLNEEPEEPPALPPPIPPRPRKHNKGIYIIEKNSILLYAPKLLLKIFKRRYLM